MSQTNIKLKVDPLNINRSILDCALATMEAKLLKRKYREADYSSSSGPNVKFSHLADDVKQNFADKDYSPKMLSAIVREALREPSAYSQLKQVCFGC